MASKPYIVVIGGPNGAGKSTIARAVLAETFRLAEFVNADTIASGLAAFNPESAAIAAGRVMLTRLRELAAARASFAFESTLASRTFAPWLAEQRAAGYGVHFVYVVVRSAGVARSRVKARVREGGHDIPSDVIERRFGRSVRNFFHLYMPLADTWRIYDNSGPRPALAALGEQERAIRIELPRVWEYLNEASTNQTKEQRRSEGTDARREVD
jgi:predicted ABC-type ATPase